MLVTDLEVQVGCWCYYPINKSSKSHCMQLPFSFSTLWKQCNVFSAATSVTDRIGLPWGGGA